MEGAPSGQSWVRAAWATRRCGSRMGSPATVCVTEISSCRQNPSCYAFYAVEPSFTIVKRLLSLKTPVAQRIMELMLFLALIWGAGWVTQNASHSGAKFVAGMIMLLGGLVGFVLMMSLLVTVFKSIEGSEDNERGRGTKQDG
jgi:hypothetical protein